MSKLKIAGIISALLSALSLLLVGGRTIIDLLANGSSTDDTVPAITLAVSIIFAMLCALPVIIGCGACACYIYLSRKGTGKRLRLLCGAVLLTANSLIALMHIIIYVDKPLNIGVYLLAASVFSVSTMIFTRFEE